MPPEAPRPERLRPTPLLAAAGAAMLLGLVLFTVNLPAQRTAVAWSCLPVLLGAAIAGAACRSAARTPGLTVGLGRMWRRFGLVCVLAGLGVAGDTRHAAAHPELAYGASRDLPTTLAYLLAMVVLFWALLRLPTGDRPREHGVRLVLDAVTVTITVAIFAWYFTTHSLDAGTVTGHQKIFTIVLSALALAVGPLGLSKVAASGLGGLERGTIRLLAVAAAVGLLGGSALPLVVQLRPGLGPLPVFVHATLWIVAFAADRQRRAVRLPRADRTRRSVSLVPYLAVAGTDALLLIVSATDGPGQLGVAAAAVCLTGIVVARQILALVENGRLLRRVDANLVELNAVQEQLTHRATHDDLTDLANRALFEQRTCESLAAGDGALSLALIDLDDFKAINDRLGHAVGDALLVVVAQRLRDCVRANDTVARLGGDEFGLLLPGLRSDEATEVLDRIGEALTRPVHALGYDLLVRASVGLAEAWPDAGPQELLRRADLAMYAAKERGKGRHAVYDERLERHQAADAQLGAALRQALDNDEFTLVFQPIVALPSGRWTGVETLVRWHTPERGFVGPDTFIPIAERTGLIVPLGDWILRTALRQAVTWDETYGAAAPHELGVNVSARQLREPGFAEDVRRALDETGFDPRRLVVEVTETAVFDGGVALDTLHELVKLGARIALDDFGTGHSSLGLLRSCPASILKVDKSFVDGIGGRSEEAVIATAMIQITGGLHLQAIAEGVETAAQAETLYRLGYRFAQGYHFSRPLSPEQAGAELDRSDRRLEIS